MIRLLLLVLLSWSLLPAQQKVIYVTRGEKALEADLFLPAATDKPVAAVVYIHGGGWRGGNRAQFQRHAARMAELGFAGLCVQYRFQQEAKWPAPLDDVTAAVDWLRAHAKEYNIDPRRIGAAGGSAGGHLAAMLGVRGNVRAVAAFNPALDLIALGNHDKLSNSVKDLIGAAYAENPSLWKSASPIENVSPRSAPFLLLHGTADATVPFEHTERMLRLLTKAGVRAELMPAEKQGHGCFNQEPWFTPARDRMIEFFQRELK